jgi:signal transduction histidine kinase/ligand-binding sensor domain-containing protein
MLFAVTHTMMCTSEIWRAKALLLGFVLAVVLVPAIGQQPASYRVVHEMIGTEEGLPNRFINALHRTDKDLLFLAHSQGLHYYDGFQFHEVDLKGHFLDNGVQDILEDSKGRLWLTDRKTSPIGPRDFHVVLFDLRSKTLSTLQEAYPELYRQGLQRVTCLHSNASGIQLSFDHRHHYHFSDTFRLIRRDEPAKWFWYDSVNGDMWLKGELQLTRISLSGERKRHTLPPGWLVELRLINGSVQIVMLDPQLSTLYRLDAHFRWQTLERQVWHKDIPFPTGYLDRLTTLGWRWRKSLISLSLEDPKGSTHFVQGMPIPGSLDWNGVALPLYLDKQDEMWFIADHKMHHIYFRPQFFSEQYLQTDPPASVRAIAMDQDSFLYLATYKGVYRLKPREGKGPELYHPAKIGYSLTQGREGKLVMGTHTEDIRLINAQDSRNPLPVILDGGHPADKLIVYFDTLTDRYWCGTPQGLLVEEPGKPWQKVPLTGQEEGPHIRYIQRLDGQLWVGSDAGLYTIRPDRRAVHHPGADSAIAHLAILHLSSDQDHYFLATKKNGLVIVRKKDWKATFYSRKNHGLVSDVIYAALPDPYGWIWLPSDRGLMRLDPRTSNLQVFDINSGLPEQEFNTNAYFRDAEGYLYLGTLNGMVRFHPLDIPLNPYSGARLYFDAILINNQPWPAADLFLMEENPVIQLPAGNMHWSLLTHFSDLGGKRSLRLGYRLKDSDQPWTFSSSNILVLPVRFAGNYLFEIGVFPREGSMPFEVREITFIVPKPWRIILIWAIAVFLFAGILVGAILRRRTVLYRQRNRELKAALDIHTRDLQEKSLRLEESNRIKDHMLSILGHELRNPLLGFRKLSDKLTYLLRKDDRERILQVSDAIEKQSSDLLGRIDNLMEWARIQRGQMELQLVKLDLSEVIQDLIRNLQAQSNAKEVTIKYVQDGEAMIWADMHGLQFILNNLLSNALKFSRRGSTITIRTENKEDHQILEVNDQGIGMDATQMERLLNGDLTMPTAGTEGEKGSGLGWTIIRELIHRLGGSIRIASSSDGTSIAISIPAYHLSTDLSAKSILS